VTLPFTRDQFLAIFAAYNEAVAPLQLLLLAAGICAVVLALRPTQWSDRVVGGVLAGLWLWMAVEYHWRFFRSINPAAMLFAVAFLIEAALLAEFAVHRRLRFRAKAAASGTWGGWVLALVIYALALYPAIGWALGHRYPSAPTFGVPCPTTIVTLGLLAWSEERPPLVLMAIPWAWTLVGTAAALQLGMREDLGLLVALVISVVGWRTHLPRTAASSPASA
jgi:hypothetical protein